MIVFQDSYGYNLWLSFLCWRMIRGIFLDMGFMWWILELYVILLSVNFIKYLLVFAEYSSH